MGRLLDGYLRLLRDYTLITQMCTSGVNLFRIHFVSCWSDLLM